MAPRPNGVQLDVTFFRGAVLRLTAAREVKQLTAADAAGPLELRREGGAWIPARAPTPPLTIRYRVDADDPFAAQAPRGLSVDPFHMRAPGGTLLLPPSWDDRRLSVTLDIEPVVVDGQATTSASSFGLGPTTEVSARGGELRDALFLSGVTGTAVFDAREGHDEAAWLGVTHFDPRQAVADLAGFRTALGSVLGNPDPSPFTFLITSEARRSGAFSVSPAARSLLLQVGAGQSFDGALRITLGATLARRWLGPRLFVGDPKTPGSWFTLGVARALARDLLFRFGLITNEELVDEIDAMLAVLVTSPLRDESEVALEAMGGPGRAVLLARGAIYALALDARLRDDPEARRLPERLQRLMARARKRRGPLPLKAWVEEMGEASSVRALHQELVVAGKLPRLSPRALGPCFRAAPRTFRALDLGFDLEESRHTGSIAGLRGDGPAARAGLLPTDALVSVSPPMPDPDRDLTVTVRRDGTTTSLRYRPAGPPIAGTSFRVADGATLARYDNCYAAR